MYFILSLRTLLLIGQNVSNMDHNSFMIYVRQLVDILQIFFKIRQSIDMNRDIKIKF